MAKHHQVAIADNRGQDIVEIMRNAASKLSHRLHFGCLCHLAFQLGFLAVVLQPEEHRRVAKTANSGD